MVQLGAYAHGEILESGRMPDCCLGLLLDPSDTEDPRVLVIAPAALLDPSVPQPDGIVLYGLVTGHPDRLAQELVFVADLAVELRAWPLRHLGQSRRGPAGGRRRGHRRLAEGSPQGPPARQADRRGGLAPSGQP